ncbi:hypothetical protein PT276_06600 [Orbaceae bacterium ESL0721]|nr:hypothetical protein [Orbaceae bacterium ESL0721]
MSATGALIAGSNVVIQSHSAFGILMATAISTQLVRLTVKSS